MLKTRPKRTRRYYSRFMKYPTRKTIRAIIKGSLESSDKKLRDMEAKMAQHEEANKRPVTIAQMRKLAKQIWA